MRVMSQPVGLPEVVESDLVRQVARSLTAAIVQGHLRPGAKVSEAAVARELGISRAPVREAARLLENQGLLRASPRRGFFVRELSAADVDELYDLRICVERHAAVAASRRLTPEARVALRRQLDLMDTIAREDDPSTIVEADYQFHRMICEAAGNGRLLRLFDGLASELRIVIGLIGRLYDDPMKLARAHVPLLDAIEAGRPDAILAEVDHHLGVARREVGLLLQSLSPAKPDVL